MQIQDLRLAPIDNPDRFEHLCLEVFRIKYNDPNIQRNGSKGQAQNGVDIFCHLEGRLEWVGIQCKVRNRSQGLTIKEVQRDLSLARTFNPKLAHYVVATTSDRDAKVQEGVRIHNSRSPELDIQMFFWDDLQELLSDQAYQTVLYRYYKGFFIDALKRGYIHGRLMTIRMGRGKEYDTQHEIILGRIPVLDQKREWDIYYYQDRYFICDLNSRTFDLFTKETSPGDFEYVIKSKLDREMLSNWINSIDLDKVLFEEDMTYGYLMSDSEFRKFIDRNKE